MNGLARVSRPVSGPIRGPIATRSDRGHDNGAASDGAARQRDKPLDPHEGVPRRFVRQRRLSRSPVPLQEEAVPDYGSDLHAPERPWRYSTIVLGFWDAGKDQSLQRHLLLRFRLPTSLRQNRLRTHGVAATER